jgi:uncharacterized membrane protein YdjX (TVP38/TMEM64 family)
MVGLGLLASVSPSTLIAFAALLASGRPKRNAVAFLVGWNISLIIVFTLCYGASKSTLSTLHTDGHVVTCVVEVVLGVAVDGRGLVMFQRGFRRTWQICILGKRRSSA